MVVGLAKGRLGRERDEQRRGERQSKTAVQPGDVDDHRHHRQEAVGARQDGSRDRRGDEDQIPLREGPLETERKQDGSRDECRQQADLHPPQRPEGERVVERRPSEKAQWAVGEHELGTEVAATMGGHVERGRPRRVES